MIWMVKGGRDISSKGGLYTGYGRSQVIHWAPPAPFFSYLVTSVKLCTYQTAWGNNRIWTNFKGLRVGGTTCDVTNWKRARNSNYTQSGGSSLPISDWLCCEMAVLIAKATYILVHNTFFSPIGWLKHINSITQSTALDWLLGSERHQAN